MAAPNVYAAINAISAEFAREGIPKANRNPVDEYDYRSIDDVMFRLSPLLAKHRLCILPRVLERNVVDRTTVGDLLVFSTQVRVSFSLVSADDGSMHVIEAYGEALDGADKGTAKAMSAAFKGAMLQTFCIPVAGSDDADATSLRLKRPQQAPEPVEGWEEWTRGIADLVAACETEFAIDRVQERYRSLLLSLAREQPELYAELGAAFSARQDALQTSGATTTKPSVSSTSKGRPRKSPKVAPGA